MLRRALVTLGLGGLLAPAWGPVPRDRVWSPCFGDSEARYRRRRVRTSVAILPPFIQGDQDPFRGSDAETGSVSDGPEIDGAGLSLLSWNILADDFIAKTKDGSYDTVDPLELSWERRCPRILAILGKAHSDVICLQEVEKQAWEDDLLPVLRSQGYEGRWQDPPKRRATRIVGNAVLFRSDKFRVAWEVHQERALVLGLTGRPRPGESANLDPLPSLVAVANLHLEGRRGAGLNRITQLRAALSAVEKRCGSSTGSSTGSTTPRHAQSVTLGSPSGAKYELEDEANGEADGDDAGDADSGDSEDLWGKRDTSTLPFIVCGDYNSGRAGIACKLLETGQLPKRPSDRGYSLKLSPKETREFSHRWSLAAAYGHGDRMNAEVTKALESAANITAARGGRLSQIDHIHFTPRCLKLLAVRRTAGSDRVTVEELGRGIPNHHHPSDHLPLEAFFAAAAGTGDASGTAAPDQNSQRRARNRRRRSTGPNFPY